MLENLKLWQFWRLQPVQIHGLDWAYDNNGGCHVLQDHKEQFDEDWNEVKQQFWSSKLKDADMKQGEQCCFGQKSFDPVCRNKNKETNYNPWNLLLFLQEKSTSVTIRNFHIQYDMYWETCYLLLLFEQCCYPVGIHFKNFKMWTSND